MRVAGTRVANTCNALHFERGDVINAEYVDNIKCEQDRNKTPDHLDILTSWRYADGFITCEREREEKTNRVGRLLDVRIMYADRLEGVNRGRVRPLSGARHLARGFPGIRQSRRLNASPGETVVTA